MSMDYTWSNSLSVLGRFLSCTDSTINRLYCNLDQGCKFSTHKLRINKKVSKEEFLIIQNFPNYKTNGHSSLAYKMSIINSSKIYYYKYLVRIHNFWSGYKCGFTILSIHQFPFIKNAVGYNGSKYYRKKIWPLALHEFYYFYS